MHRAKVITPSRADHRISLCAPGRALSLSRLDLFGHVPQLRRHLRRHAVQLLQVVLQRLPRARRFIRCRLGGGSRGRVPLDSSAALCLCSRDGRLRVLLDRLLLFLRMSVSEG